MQIRSCVWGVDVMLGSARRVEEANPECLREPIEDASRSGRGRAVQAQLRRRGCERELALEPAQCGAQAFFDDRVVERAVEHVLHRVAALRAPREQIA